MANADFTPTNISPFANPQRLLARGNPAGNYEQEFRRIL
jgi:hypothetical protein